jgi:hypothetical protein
MRLLDLQLTTPSDYSFIALHKARLPIKVMRWASLFLLKVPGAAPLPDANLQRDGLIPASEQATSPATNNPG